MNLETMINSHRPPGQSQEEKSPGSGEDRTASLFRGSILSTSLRLIDLGRKEYLSVLTLQQELREQRLRDEIPDTILLVEHEPVYTLGKDPVAEEKLLKEALPAPLVRINRGGKITYHGPGQLVGYLILKLPLENVGLLVSALENLTIATVAEYGLVAYSRQQEMDAYGKNIRGTWCTLEGMPKKVAAIGIEVKSAGRVEQENKHRDRRVVTMHGFALNINTDLNYFKFINPCGFTYEAMTSMAQVLGRSVDFTAVKEYCQEKIRLFLPPCVAPTNS